MPFIPHLELLKKHKGKILIGTFSFWLIIAFMVYITEVIAHNFLGSEFLDDVEKKQYAFRLVLWLILTPLIIALALKINVGDYNIVLFVFLHFIFATVMLTLEFIIESSVMKPVAENFYHRPVAWGELMLPYLYKYFAYIINYFLIIGIVNIYVYMNTLQKTQQNLMETELQNNDLKYQLALSQLQALKMQIHPHFLFNTHHSIIGLIVKKENEKAAQMLTRLSDLLRLTIEKQNAEFVSLNEELKIIDLYLDIQILRFKDRFTYSKNIATAAASFLLPYFILQPLVENAVIHGVEKLDENAFIKINASLENDCLQIEVINNNHEGNSLSTKKGIGLSNVSERLNQYYGQRASFQLFKDNQGNTVARLNIPPYEK